MKSRFSLILIVCGLATTAVAQEQTLWLVRGLYPGQEALIERTEKALGSLLPADARASAVIGREELTKALAGKVVTEVPCFAVEARCKDPVDRFVTSFGFARVVLVQGGHDDGGFHFNVTAYEPGTGKATPASAVNTAFEAAFLGALAKVVPIAATVEVKSTPPGASVFIDDVKAGVTPLTTQVLPGQHQLRFDLKLHEPHEELVTVPIRGHLSFDKPLEKVAARVTARVSPDGAQIFLDGASVGKDRLDRGIAPGMHTLRFEAEGHRAFETTFEVKPGQQIILEKALELAEGPLTADSGKVQLLIQEESGREQTQILAEKRADGTQPPPSQAVEIKPGRTKPAEEELDDATKIRLKKSYFNVSLAYAAFTENQLIGRRFENAPARTTRFVGQRPGLMGVSVEFGTGGEYVGVSIVGLTWLTSVDPFSMTVGCTAARGWSDDGLCETRGGNPTPISIDRTSVHFLTLQLLQPQVRFAVWKFLFGVQLGVEARVGWIQGFDPGTDDVTYEDGFMALDMLASARINMRFYIYDGFYAHLQWHYALSILSIDSAVERDNPGRTFGGIPNFQSSQTGFNVGVGYAF